MDTIFTRQNEQKNIDLLCAQKQLYIEAKRIFKFQIVLTCVVIISMALLKIVLSLFGINISAETAIVSTIIGFADISLMVTSLSDYKKKAAKAQEEFDCNVFSLPWKKNFIGSGKNPPDVINKYCRKFVDSGRDVSKLQDWYSPELSKFIGFAAILHCQRSSTVYDANIRNRFRWLAMQIALWPIGVLSLIVVFIDGPTAASVLFMVSFWPLLGLAMKIRHDQKKAIAHSEETKSIIDGLLADITGVDEQDVRDVQRRMYTGRKDGPVIPEKYYDKIRDMLEREMHENAKKAQVN